MATRSKQTAQLQTHGEVELPSVTSGDDLPAIRALLGDDGRDYSADDVIDYLLPTPDRGDLDGAEVNSAQPGVWSRVTWAVGGS